MGERWAWIPGFELEYEVSTEGRVRSYRKRIPHMMRPTADTGGYLMVRLRGQLHRVHRLVLLAFVGPSDLLTRHMDDNPQNNRLSNLVYGTTAENVADVVAHGHHVNANKTHCPQGHEYNDENTYVRRNCRTCRTCNAVAVARYKKRLVTS